MCGRAYAPRFLLTWPNARISVMGGEQAARVLATVRRDDIEAKGGKWARPRKKNSARRSASNTSTKGNPYYATARLWDDGIIDSGANAGACWALSLVGGAECADRRDAIWRVQDVTRI